MIKYGDCIIRNEKGEILLLQRSYQDDFEPGKWCLPGGKIEEGENPIEGATRELQEETNLLCLLEGPIHKEQRSDSVSYYFQGVVHTFDPTLLDNNEHYRMQWVPIDEIADYDLILDLKDILANKVRLPIFSMKMMEISVTDINDLLKRQELAENSFNKGEMSTEEYFKAQTIFGEYMIPLPEDKVKIDYVERLKKIKARRDPDEIEKAKQKAFIGEVREFGGRKHIRTISGWKYYGKGTGEKAQNHHNEANKQKTISQKIATENDDDKIQQRTKIITKLDALASLSKENYQALQEVQSEIERFERTATKEPPNRLLKDYERKLKKENEYYDKIVNFMLDHNVTEDEFLSTETLQYMWEDWDMSELENYRK